MLPDINIVGVLLDESAVSNDDLFAVSIGMIWIKKIVFNGGYGPGPTNVIIMQYIYSRPPIGAVRNVYLPWLPYKSGCRIMWISNAMRMCIELHNTLISVLCNI